MHQRWIIDFKVQLPLPNGQWLHLHTVRDPVGAAFIAAILHRVSGKHSKVSEAAVRLTLRTAFGRAGLPEEVQTDGEGALNPPRGDNFPSLFTLWLVGLGIQHLRSRPAVPTDDAEVERAHRTLYDYCLVDALPKGSLPVLQAQVEQAREELNHLYPSRAHGCAGRPPFTAHPELATPPRPFDPQTELARFDLKRVDAYLATLCFERKVGKTGQITLGGHPGRYCVGRDYAGQTVQVRFDPQQRCFVASLPDADPAENEIGRWPVKRLEALDILHFSFDPPLSLPQQLPFPFYVREPIVKEPVQV